MHEAEVEREHEARLIKRLAQLEAELARTEQALARSAPLLVIELGQRAGADRPYEAILYGIGKRVRTPEALVAELWPSGSPRTLRPRGPVPLRWSAGEEVSSSLIDLTVEEALRRDPRRIRGWKVLVDNPGVWEMLVARLARRAGVTPTMVLDVNVVLAQLVRVAQVLHPDGPDETRVWVQNHLRALLEGRRVCDIAGGLRRSANRCAERGLVNACADYLIQNAAFIQYREALSQGLPIARSSPVGGDESSQWIGAGAHDPGQGNPL
jgi:hypothetical protein